MMKRFALILALVASVVPVVAFAIGDTGTAVGNDANIYRPRICITDTVYVADGIQANIHWNQLALDLNGSSPYLFHAYGDSGTITDVGYRWQPAAVSAFASDDITITAYDWNGTAVSTDGFTVRNEPDSVGINSKVYLVIGDSVVASSTWVDVLDSLLSAHGDEPVFIGTQGSDPLHEGRGGWTYERFGTEFGGLNPFFNTDHIDFQNYCTTNSFPDPDYILVMLGGNDTVRLPWTGMNMIYAYCDTLVTAALDADTGFPNAKIIFVPSNSGSTPGANGANYGASVYYPWTTWKLRLREYYEHMIETYDAGAYASNVSVCLEHLWLNDLYSYPVNTTTARSSRDVRTITTSTNYRHPNGIGLRQIADAVYSHILCNRGIPRNLLTKSGGFDGAPWTNSAATVTGSQTDPFGGSGAEQLHDADGGSSGSSVYHASMTLSANDYVFFGWVKGISGQDNEAHFYVTNTTDAVHHGLQLAITSDGVITVDEAVNTTEYGLYLVGSGWYYWWWHLDNSSDVGDTYLPRIYPWGYSTTANDGCVVYGIDLQAGTYPGDLLVRP